MFLSLPQSAASYTACCMAVLQVLLSENAFNQRLLSQHPNEVTGPYIPRDKAETIRTLPTLLPTL